MQVYLTNTRGCALMFQPVMKLRSVARRRAKLWCTVHWPSSLQCPWGVLTWMTLQAGDSASGSATGVYDSDEVFDTVAPRQGGDAYDTPHSKRVPIPNDPDNFPIAENSTKRAQTTMTRNSFPTKASRDHGIDTNHIASHKKTIEPTNASSGPSGERRSKAISAKPVELDTPHQSTSSPSLDDRNKPAPTADSYRASTVRPMEVQVLLCTYGAKTNASTAFPTDGLCDYIFFDSIYKNDRNFLADTKNFAVDLLQFLSVIPKYSKTSFGVGFAFEYRGTLTQDLARTDPEPLEVFWKHGVYHFGILDVPVFGLKPFYMDDVFTCLKTLDTMSQRQRESGRPAYIVLSAVPYNAGWVNYVADKMKTVYQPDLFVSQGHYTYGDNEAITCAIVPPTSLFRPTKLFGYAHDLNTAALALQQLESQGASGRWSISVGMKGRLAAPLPKFPLEIFSPCYQNPVAPSFDTYTEVCNNQQLWEKPAYDTKHDAMLTRNTKMNMMFVYDNEQSLCRKLCRVKANYTKLRFGLAAFDLDYEDYSNSCRQDNKFNAFSRLADASQARRLLQGPFCGTSR
ncbi:hypothetical protein MTO96_019672 [Rhipicephalus appendiculatus]